MNYFISASISHQNLQRLTLQIFLHQQNWQIFLHQQILFLTGFFSFRSLLTFWMQWLIEMIFLVVQVCCSFLTNVTCVHYWRYPQKHIESFLFSPWLESVLGNTFSWDDIFLCLPYSIRESVLLVSTILIDKKVFQISNMPTYQVTL